MGRKAPKVHSQRCVQVVEMLVLVYNWCWCIQLQESCSQSVEDLISPKKRESECWSPARHVIGVAARLSPSHGTLAVVMPLVR